MILKFVSLLRKYNGVIMDNILTFLACVSIPIVLIMLGVLYTRIMEFEKDCIEPYFLGLSIGAISTLIFTWVFNATLGYNP